jgi:hydroxyacylglutathione hydrolase
VPGAVNRPLPDIVGGYADLPDDKDTPIVTFCKVGERSLHGLLLLKAMGHKHVRSVRGGWNAWTAAGLPTET